MYVLLFSPILITIIDKTSSIIKNKTYKYHHVYVYKQCNPKVRIAQPNSIHIHNMYIVTHYKPLTILNIVMSAYAFWLYRAQLDMETRKPKW